KGWCTAPPIMHAMSRFMALSFAVDTSRSRAKRSTFKAKLNVGLRQSQTGEVATFVSSALVKTLVQGLSRRRPSAAAPPPGRPTHPHGTLHEFRRRMQSKVSRSRTQIKLWSWSATIDKAQQSRANASTCTVVRHSLCCDQA